MIQRYKLSRDNLANCECDYFPASDGSWVTHDDHLAALTVTEAMVERAAGVIYKDQWHISMDLATKQAREGYKITARKALEAALAPEAT